MTQFKASFLLYLFFSLNAAKAETLEEAWGTALNSNHQIKAAQANTQASQESLLAAQGQMLPQLNFRSGYTQYNESPGAKTTIEGQTVNFTTQQAGSVNAQALASIPIFTSGKITQNIHAAQANLSATQANETVIELDLKMRIADAYISVLRAESLLEVVKQHLESLTAHAHDVQNQFEQGIVARNDILAANVEVLNAQQAITYTATQLDNAKAQYNQLLTRPLTQAVQLAKKFPSLPKENEETLTDNALKNRPELLVLTQKIDELEAQKEGVKADLLPQVSANGGYNYQQNRYQAHEGLWMANVGVEWKAFDGTTSHKSDSLTRQVLALQEQKETLQAQIQLQIRQAWLESQETQQRITVAQQAITQANENSKVMNDRYQQGLATHTDVIHAEDLRTTSYQNWHQATYDLALATLRLQRALGNL
ncbi:MAG: hypothetical protein RL755_767 [Pseudomonadota bacterium]